MKDKLEAVNNALVFLGQTPIAALDQGTPVADRAASVVDAAIEEVLRAHPWNFAIKRVLLDPLAEAPAFGFTYQFQRPADWLRTLEVPSGVKREGQKFLYGKESLRLVYIFRETTLAEWDALAAAALARNLASKLGYVTTKSRSTVELQWTLYEKVLSQARAVDAQEEEPPEFAESTLISSRRR